MARGTVRAGSRTSPTGINATSMPSNAKISRIEAWPTCDSVGIENFRYAGLSAHAPATISTSSGASFATVMASTSRMPGFTPRMRSAIKGVRHPFGVA